MLCGNAESRVGVDCMACGLCRFRELDCVLAESICVGLNSSGVDIMLESNAEAQGSNTR